MASDDPFQLRLLDAHPPTWFRVHNYDMAKILKILNAVIPVCDEFPFYDGRIKYHQGQWRQYPTGLSLMKLAQPPTSDASMDRLIGHYQLLEDKASKATGSLIMAKMRQQGLTTHPLDKDTELYILADKLLMRSIKKNPELIRIRQASKGINN